MGEYLNWKDDREALEARAAATREQWAREDREACAAYAQGMREVHDRHRAEDRDRAQRARDLASERFRDRAIGGVIWGIYLAPFWLIPLKLIWPTS